MSASYSWPAVFTGGLKLQRWQWEAAHLRSCRTICSKLFHSQAGHLPFRDCEPDASFFFPLPPFFFLSLFFFSSSSGCGRFIGWSNTALTFTPASMNIFIVLTAPLKSSLTLPAGSRLGRVPLQLGGLYSLDTTTNCYYVCESLLHVHVHCISPIIILLFHFKLGPWVSCLSIYLSCFHTMPIIHSKSVSHNSHQQRWLSCWWLYFVPMRMK